MKYEKGQSGNRKGRPKGVPNRVTSDLRLMVLQALEQAGSVAYLQRQANENPSAFMALLGKILPKEVSIAGSDRPLLIIKDYTGRGDPDSPRKGPVQSP